MSAKGGARRLRAFPELGLSQNKTLFSECKNDIGVARTCHKAPKGFQSAAEISGVILLGVAPRQQALQIEPLAVSRYHRLGGGDIDGAIVYEVLVPQLCEQNGLSALDLGFDDKKNYVGPAYLGLAETLKISLCTQISRLLRFNKYEGMDKTQIMAKRPGVHPCHLPFGALTLQSPTLSASDFEKLLAPFLDQDLLYARETEYRLTCSRFAPLQDALERSGVAAGEVDFCLAVGGSSLIPQVIAALQKFLSQARLLT